MNPLELLDRPIAFHRCFVELTGSITAALMLSQAVYWQRRVPEGRDGWWYKNQAEWTEETGMTRYEQETARRKLRDLGVLEEERRGIPARLWYRVNEDALTRLLEALPGSKPKGPSSSGGSSSQSAEKPHSSLREPHNLDCGNPANRAAGIPQTITETTTETTTENTHTGAAQESTADPDQPTEPDQSVCDFEKEAMDWARQHEFWSTRVTNIEALRRNLQEGKSFRVQFLKEKTQGTGSCRGHSPSPLNGFPRRLLKERWDDIEQRGFIHLQGHAPITREDLRKAGITRESLGRECR